MEHPFSQVDVFSAEPYRGNPLAVVMAAETIPAEEMQRIAHWTNLSETAFVLPPEDPAADYRVRIFTPTMELPFAGHPTLGTAHAWLEAGGQAKRSDVVIQECGVGLITIRSDDGRLAFEAPPLIRSGPVDDSLHDQIAAALQIDRGAMLDTAWIDNGPGWVGVRLGSVEELLALTPRASDLKIGAFALGDRDQHDGPDIEVRAFFPKDGATFEDPVTGSLNASLAQWLLGNGTLEAPYVAGQGTVLGRSGRVFISQESADADGQTPPVWVGGHVVTCVRGSVVIP